MRLLCVVWLSRLKGTWPASALALGLVFLDRLGLNHSGLCLLIYCEPRGPLTNRCLETPQGYNLDSSPRAFLRIHEPQS
jgi:hypothetical protein